MRRTPVLALVTMLLAAPARGQEVSGTVFELIAGKRTPAADAFVIVHWLGTQPGFHSHSVCIQAAIVRADAQGRFAVAEPPPLRSTLLVWRERPAVTVYKPGFDQRGDPQAAYRERAWTLVPTQFAGEQRSLYVEGIAHMGCRDDRAMPVELTDPQGVLPAFRAALASESPSKPTSGIEVRVLRRGAPRPAAP